MLATPPNGSGIISLAQIECLTDTPVIIDRVQYAQTGHLVEQGETLNCTDLTLAKSESCQFIFALKLNVEKITEKLGTVEIGGINVFWRRADGGESGVSYLFTSSLGVLPLSPPGSFPIQIKSTLPTIITQWNEFEVKLKLRND